MTKEEAKKLLPVIQAYIDGKTIESKSIEGTDDWEAAGNPYFDIDEFEYRIKPEPKYRPFVDAGECWNEMLKHQPFGWVEDAIGNNGFLTIQYVFNVDEDGDSLRIAGGTYYSYGKAFEDYTFADGTPFGIKEGGEE